MFLKKMYQNTMHIPYKESMLLPSHEKKPFNDLKKIIRLEPFGLSRQPKNMNELKRCLVCILTCLKQFHAAGYVHCDIRWNNIIKYQDDWYLIDLIKFLDFTYKWDIFKFHKLHRLPLFLKVLKCCYSIQLRKHPINHFWV